MKISRFNKFIKENVSFDYLEYFQAIIDEWSDEINVDYDASSGEIEIANQIPSSSDRRNVKDIVLETAKLSKFLKDLEHILDNMKIDGIQHRVFIDDSYNVNITITSVELGNNKLNFLYLIDIINHKLKYGINYHDLMYKCRTIRSGNVSYHNIQNDCKIGDLGGGITNELYILFPSTYDYKLNEIINCFRNEFGLLFEYKIANVDESERLANLYSDNLFRRPTIIISKKP